jgi:hypothetical protein
MYPAWPTVRVHLVGLRRVSQQEHRKLRFVLCQILKLVIHFLVYARS